MVLTHMNKAKPGTESSPVMDQEQELISEPTGIKLPARPGDVLPDKV